MAFLIDKYLPQYHFHEIHNKIINAPAERCFTAAKQIDLGESTISKFLMKARGLPVQDLRMESFLKNMCFTYVEENINEEFVIDASVGNIKIFWNFYFKRIDENKNGVTSETRILCLTKKSKFLFSIYWFFIKPFSGITRLEMLRLIKNQAEKS